MGKIIAVSNQKGGVGKTTTAVNLAASLGEKGRKVLVVDFDPQGNTTTSFGIRKKSIRNTSYEVVIGQCRLVEAIVATSFKGVSLIPTSQNLSGAELKIADMENRWARLRAPLLEVKNDYDYIFIDCPPTLNLLNINALAAADSVIIPILCEFLSLEGLVEIDDAIKKVRDKYNHRLEIEGILFTMYSSRYNLTELVVEEVKKYFPGKPFETVIPRNVSLAEAPSYGEPVLYYDKKAKGAKAYQELADELEKKLRKKEKKLQTLPKAGL